MADISKITTLDGTTYNIKDATARSSIPSAATATPLADGTAAIGSSAKYAREDHRHPSDTTKYSIANYGTGTTDISVRPLVAYARANRLAFLPADQIIIEQTTDGGATWTSSGYSDTVKRSLFATRGASVAIPLLNGAKSTQCGVRVTITGMKYNVPSGTAETSKYNYWSSSYLHSQERYSNLREMWFWLSANNDAIRIQVFRATGANPNNWVADFNTDFPATGWSGSDWVRLSGNTFGGGTTQTSNYWNWRIIFWSRMHDGDTAFRSKTQQVINGIAGYGDSVWGTPNNLMTEDHLYSWDYNMNAYFPAGVTATSFNGNASTATKATQDESGNNIKANYASSFSISGHTITLKNKNGASLGTVTVPDNNTTYTANTTKLVTTTVPNVTSVGSAPTLGTAIAADDITAWDAGSTPTLGTAIAADDITAWSAGTVPTLGTAIAADDITGWTTNTPTAASVSKGVLTITAGSAATLNYTARSIPNVTSVGTAPSLSYTARSIPNVTSVGSVPSLSYTARSIPNVTSVGSAPTLGTAITVATGSTASNGGGATVATGITAS